MATDKTGGARTITDEQLTAIKTGIVDKAAELAATKAVELVLDKIASETNPDILNSAGFKSYQASPYALSRYGISGEDRERLKHAAKWFVAAATKSKEGLSAVYNERPSYYPEHVKAAFSEASSGAGNYTVPSIWNEMVYSNVEAFGFARKIAHVFPMPAKDIKFTAGGAVTVSWPGANTAPTPFDASSFFTQTSLTANTMAAAYILQKELLDDTIIDLMGYLANQYAIAIAKEEDLQYFNGTGSPFTGIIGTSGVKTAVMAAGLTGFANVSWVHMNNLKLSVNTGIQNTGLYVIPQSVLGYLYNEKDQDLRPIRNVNGPEPAGLPGIGVSQAPFSYNNSPLYTVPDALFPSSAANRCCGIFGDFKNFGILGIRKDLTVETFDQAYGGVDLSGQRQIAVQVLERMAVAFPDPTAFGLLKTAAS